MKRAGGACPRGTQGSMSLNAAYQKEQQYMVYGWGSERYPRYNTFYEMKKVVHAPGGLLWDPWSMSLNAPHHKEQEYIWFMGGDLNGFRDIMHFVKRGWDAPAGHPGLSRSMSLNAPYLKEQEYVVYGLGSERFPRYNIFYEMKGVGHAPGDTLGIHGPCH